MDTAELDQSKTIGYFCPACKQAVLVTKSVFALLAARTELACACGRSHGELECAEDKVRLTVPCLSCGKSHTVICSTEQFLKTDTLIFSCKASGLACCFVGTEEKVRAAMGRLQGTVEKLGTKEQDGVFLDPLVMEEVLGELKDIAARDGISCVCGSHRWRMQVKYSAVDLICADCGAAVRIPAAAQEDIDDLCCKSRILLKKI